MGTKKWWHRAAAAACVTGLVLGLALAGAGTASAAVNQNAVQNNEPDYNPSIGGMKATQVYSFTFPGLRQQPSLTVAGGSDAPGAIVNTWARVNGTTYPWGTVLNPNQLWEFIPDSTNAGSSITTGFGYLRSRESGECLELNLSDGKIDQWPCVPGAANELWRNYSGGLLLKYNFTLLGTNSPAGCAGQTPDGNGETLYLRGGPSDCTSIIPKKENYRFASNPISVTGPTVIFTDNAGYKCMNGYTLRMSSMPGSHGYGALVTDQNRTAFDAENISDRPSVGYAWMGNKLAYEIWDYTDLAWVWGPFTGQSYLFCQPS